MRAAAAAPRLRVLLRLLFRLDDWKGREGGELRAGSGFSRSFRFLVAFFLIFSVDRPKHLLFGLGSSLLQPFESAQDHLFGDDLSHGGHRTFGVAAEYDAIQLFTLWLAGRVERDISG